jgi:hypothetical protein
LIPRAQNDESQKNEQPDTPDLEFLAKLVVVSFAGGAVIKYGSLLSDVPFSANSSVALGLVLLPPIAYSIYFSLKN